jgi:hypothetical protein
MHLYLGKINLKRRLIIINGENITSILFTTMTIFDFVESFSSYLIFDLTGNNRYIKYRKKENNVL